MGWTAVLTLSAGIFLLLTEQIHSAPLQRSESLKTIEKLKTKLESLHTVLADLENDLSAYEARGLEPEVSANKAETDGDLQDFESQLSEADRELVSKMKSRVKFLQAALHKASAAEENDKADEKRGQAQGSNLSAQDKAMLEKYPSYAHFLETAMNTKHENNAEEESTGEEQKRGNNQIIDPELQALFNQFSPADQKLLQNHASKMHSLTSQDHAQKQEKDKKAGTEIELLEAIKSKLGEIKDSLQKERPGKCKNDSNCDYAVKMHDGVFKDFVNKGIQEKEVSDNEGWMQGPVDNSKLGINEKCKDGEDCNKNPVKECKGEDCNKPLTHKEMVEDVKKKLLGDMAYAKKSGVSTDEILKVLMTAKRARRMIDEAEEEDINIEDLNRHAFM